MRPSIPIAVRALGSAAPLPRQWLPPLPQGFLWKAFAPKARASTGLEIREMVRKEHALLAGCIGTPRRPFLESPAQRFAWSFGASVVNDAPHLPSQSRAVQSPHWLLAIGSVGDDGSRANGNLIP